MPAKKNTTPHAMEVRLENLELTMEARLQTLEHKYGTMEVALIDIQMKQTENFDKLFAMITHLPQKITPAENEKFSEASFDKGTPKVDLKLSETSRLHGDVLDEFRLSVKKVELPMFSGEDPVGWIARAEALIEEDEAMTWEVLKQALLERYGGVSDGNVFEQLSSLQQEGNVEEFIEDFECLLSQIPRISDEQFFGYFRHGLIEGIRGRVRSLIALGPASRARLMNITKVVDCEFDDKASGRASKKPTGSNSQNGGGNQICGGINKPGEPHDRGRSSNNDLVYVRSDKDHNERGEALSGDKTTMTNDKREQGNRDKGIHHLSSKEIAERRQKRLCFKCGGSYHPRHQCPDKQLRVMVAEEDATIKGT
ncbi:hypothetical protein TSUD_147380 [Trifolium subterraneum]|uniref:Retrotransposon gag domain-containing protein n=1 Tax=Trifolium subterraneum TaxID=3900 RepID=A0A2Z6N1K6_TRISU|nr:hypothetical protein TSUD_147380 [Trifolium subterraneum]